MSGKYLKCFQIFWNHVPMLGKQLKTNSRPQYVVPTKSQEIFAAWVVDPVTGRFARGQFAQRTIRP